MTLTSLIRKGRVCSKTTVKGNVDFFSDTGGYGFILADDADDDVFSHMEDIGGSNLEEGANVEFDVEQAPKGPRVTNLTRL